VLVKTKLKLTNSSQALGVRVRGDPVTDFNITKHLGVIVVFTPTAEGYGFSTELLWSGLKPGCQAAKLRHP